MLIVHLMFSLYLNMYTPVTVCIIKFHDQDAIKFTSESHCETSKLKFNIKQLD